MTTTLFPAEKLVIILKVILPGFDHGIIKYSLFVVLAYGRIA